MNILYFIFVSVVLLLYNSVVQTLQISEVHYHRTMTEILTTIIGNMMINLIDYLTQASIMSPKI